MKKCVRNVRVPLNKLIYVRQVNMVLYCPACLGKVRYPRNRRRQSARARRGNKVRVKVEHNQRERKNLRMRVCTVGRINFWGSKYTEKTTIYE